MTDRYRVGALTVVAENWPDDWHAYARDQYPRTDLHGGAPLTLRVRPEGVEANAWELGATQRLSIDTCAAGYRFFVRYAFEAIYSAGHIEVESVSSTLGPHFTLCNILRAVSSVAYALDYDGLMLHAGCGIFHGRGVVFCGKSGAGKTTISLGMRETVYISDDISLVQNLSTTPILVGSPFYGSRGVGGAQEDSPLAAMGILGQSIEGTEIYPFPPQMLVPELLRHVVCFTRDPAVVAANMSQVIRLAESVFVAQVVRDLRDSADTVVNALLAARDEHFVGRG